MKSIFLVKTKDSISGRTANASVLVDFLYFFDDTVSVIPFSICKYFVICENLTITMLKSLKDIEKVCYMNTVIKRFHEALSPDSPEDNS